MCFDNIKGNRHMRQVNSAETMNFFLQGRHQSRLFVVDDGEEMKKQKL